MTEQARRRLVVTCDDPWQLSDQVHISNVEKLTRCIQVDETSDGVPQVVLPQSGRGTTASTKRQLGHYSSRGLGANLAAAYRFLCYNYLPGDDIFLFGGARGALTARRLAGMIGKYGLLSREASVRGLLPQVIARYQGATAVRLLGESDEEFRSRHGITVPITFLGVFETIGALGIPGRLPSRRQSFHDVQLSRAVQCARQALAVDEPRLAYQPSLWSSPEDDAEPGRVKQVWFEGCHSDVAGGYAESGLADTTLLWMATEAGRLGLVLDLQLLDTYVGSGSSAVRHDPARVKGWHRRPPPDSFVGAYRRLRPPGAVGVHVASSVLEHLEANEHYSPPNLMDHVHAGESPAVEDVVWLPDPDWRKASAQLEDGRR